VTQVRADEIADDRFRAGDEDPLYLPDIFVNGLTGDPLVRGRVG
jgi:hypothetical protein